ncbi:transforming growth factor-beta-induced protein ig-h3-like [Ostrea edulis]|uniref:transforming growth factor-beta-induced protein ig-h3-like n=1 Tax=Ostrea edulis TaxID=37623 RepID=UPI0024AED3B2|nr:transforming growth factor-beta-induced protein ig-h3-like [Ostrea edulis]
MSGVMEQSAEENERFVTADCSGHLLFEGPYPSPPCRGTFTVFAPTNRAFEQLPPLTLAYLSNNTNALAEVLKYHVVPGSVVKSAASNELQVTSLEGSKIRFNVYPFNNLTVTVDGVRVNAFDILASNGVVHIIDAVMIAPAGDIVTQLNDHYDFTTLVSKVTQAGLAGDLMGNNLTVFAPNNAAFAKLSTAALQRLENDKNMLREVLLYHVVPHTVYSAGLFNKEKLSTLDTNGDSVQISMTSQNVYLNLYSQVTEADVTATNGVIHVIDHVMVPDRYYISLVVG